MDSEMDMKAKAQEIYEDEDYPKQVFLSDIIMEATGEAIMFVKDGPRTKTFVEDVQYEIDDYMVEPFVELSDEEVAKVTDLVQFVLSLLAKAEADPETPRPFVRELSEYLDYEE